MQIPYKQMFSWKTGNLAPTLIGLWYVLLPLLMSKAINISLMLFGFTFLSISLIRAKSKPTVLGSVFCMLIGLSYFLGMMNTIPDATLWTMSLALFALTLVFELDIFKFGPTNARAKILTIVPLAVIGFTLLLALVGYNPLLSIQWTSTRWIINLNYVSVLVLCWVSVLDYAGWRPFKNHTVLVMNLMALLAVVLSVVSMTASQSWW